MADENIVEKIESMLDKGKLTIEQSIDLILQVTFELYKGQKEISKSLAENEITHKDLIEEVAVHSENIKAITKDINELFELTRRVEKYSIMIWVEKHPKLFTSFVVVLMLIIQFHEVLTNYLFAILGYKLP